MIFLLKKSGISFILWFMLSPFGFLWNVWGRFINEFDDFSFLIFIYKFYYIILYILDYILYIIYNRKNKNHFILCIIKYILQRIYWIISFGLYMLGYMFYKKFCVLWEIKVSFFCGDYKNIKRLVFKFSRIPKTSENFAEWK